MCSPGASLASHCYTPLAQCGYWLRRNPGTPLPNALGCCAPGCSRYERSYRSPPCVAMTSSAPCRLVRFGTLRVPAVPRRFRCSRRNETEIPSVASTPTPRGSSVQPVTQSRGERVAKRWGWISAPLCATAGCHTALAPRPSPPAGGSAVRCCRRPSPETGGPRCQGDPRGCPQLLRRPSGAVYPDLRASGPDGPWGGSAPGLGAAGLALGGRS